MDRLALVALLLSAVGSGLMAGLFFAFSAFMMTALGRLPAAQGTAAMQAINVAIVNPAFLLLFLGTTISCLVLVVSTLLAPAETPIAARLVGAALFVAGAFGVTVLRNVPLNNQLAAIDPTSPEVARCWVRYRSAWTGWNHVRTLSATGAAIALTLALTG